MKYQNYRTKVEMDKIFQVEVVPTMEVLRLLEPPNNLQYARTFSDRRRQSELKFITHPK
jgi:hypothetical protein